jgi:hypothetical protein
MGTVDWLKQLLDRGAGKPDVEDDVLGALVYDRDERLWRASVHFGKQPLDFLIAGDDRPAEALLEHARDLAADLPGLRGLVAAFLTDEATRLPIAESEIEGLQLEQVCLFWPDRPDDGMLYFAESADGRLWRCDYVHRSPQNLGFDG